MRKVLMLLTLFLFIHVLNASEKTNAIIAKIKQEGFQNSQVMETVSYLTDVHGPRLLGTPGYLEAAEWSRAALAGWGSANARLEPFGSEHRGWEATSFAVEMTAPRYTPLLAWPKAWTQGTKGEINGVPVHIDGDTELDSLQKYRGRLVGKIVLLGASEPTEPSFVPFTTRFTEEQLLSSEKNIAPYPDESTWLGHIAEKHIIERLTADAIDKPDDDAWYQFFIDEGVAALIAPSDFDHGILHVDGTYFTRKDDITPVPYFVMANEHYGRLVRMFQKGVSPELQLHLDTKFYEEPDYNVNILADIPGMDKKHSKEIVMIGAHFDSWHAGTGAVDNAAGSAVMMEAMRILLAIGAEMKRTVRIGLWGGEEEGYYGSLGYISQHAGDIFSGEKKSEQGLISAYFNCDNGSGKIRGIYLQGNEAVRPIFESYLKPFTYIDSFTLTAQNASYTDHEPFDALNIPAFQFIQDPLNYMTVTHHTNLDLYDYVIEEDLMQSAVIVAALVYQVANRDEMLPRKD